MAAGDGAGGAGAQRPLARLLHHEEDPDRDRREADPEAHDREGQRRDPRGARLQGRVPPDPDQAHRVDADVIGRGLAELMGLLQRGEVRVDFDGVPLSQVTEVWARDQRGRRPVFVP